MTSDEREIFCDLVAASKPDAFKASDLPLLVAYTRAIGLERSAAQQLAAEPDNKGAMMRWEKSTKAMVALSMRLRLSPQSRAPNNPTNRPGSKPERELSYYEKMALMEAGDGSS